MAKVVRDTGNIISLDHALNSKVVIAIEKSTDFISVVVEYNADAYSLGLIEIDDLLSGNISQGVLSQEADCSEVDVDMRDYLESLLGDYELHAFDSIKDALIFLNEQCG